MYIPTLTSIKTIEQRFRTGEEPVLVVCSDKNSYICKYMRSSASAYKLVCELVGSIMAVTWKLNTPSVAFININPKHCLNAIQNYVSAPSWGSCKLEKVIDITPSTYALVDASMKQVTQLLKIALFDCWIANEDRNINNANLLYDIENQNIVSIDYGCIFNTATFEYPISQLTSTDTILYSDLFQHLMHGQNRADIQREMKTLRMEYNKCVDRSQRQIGFIIQSLPPQWNISQSLMERKLLELFGSQWIDSVWRNFVELLNDNVQDG